MGNRLSNTDAIICWCFAVAEIVGFITYLCLAVPRLRRKIVSMGRLIPSVQMLVAGGGAPVSYQIAVPTAPYQEGNTQMYPPQPPPTGFYQSDQYTANPPSYSSLSQK